MKRSNLILAVAMSSLFAVGAGFADDAVIIRQARELQMAKKYDEAIKLYEASVKNNASERLYVDYAALLINLKKYVQCDELLTKASDIYPDSLRIKNALGMAKYKKGDLSGASALFSQVLSKDSENKYAKTMLETIRKEKSSSSPIDVAKGAEIDSNAGDDADYSDSFVGGAITFNVSDKLSLEEQQELAKKLYGEMTKMDEQDLDGFIRLHKQVIEKCPKTDQAQESCWRLSNLYFLGYQPPDFENCMAVLEHLLKQYPDTPLMPDAKNRLIVCSKKTENFDKVCKLYEELFQKDPEPDDTTFMIRALEYADALASANRIDDAKAWYMKVIEKDDGKNTLQARAATRKLGNL
jgi:tetratricopeptide (TPR) repeat protein